MNIRIFNLAVLVGWLMALVGGVLIHPGWGIAVAGGLLLVLSFAAAYLAGLYVPGAKIDRARHTEGP